MQLTIAQTKQFIHAVFNANRVPFLRGEPGIGKSAGVFQYAEDNDYDDVLDLRLSCRDPVDTVGIPSVEHGRTVFSNVPDFFPDPNSKKRGILFVDEFPQAPPSVMNVFSQLIHDGRLGSYIFPKTWKMILAGNLDSNRAATHRVPQHIENRCVKATVIVDLEEWCKWALTNKIATEVIAFIRFRSELLHKFDASMAEFPSPRTWHMVSDLQTVGIPPEIELQTIAGAVGEGPATEYCGFLRVFRQLPNPDAVIMSPDTADVPDDPATLYALASTLARRASKSNLERIVKYLARIPQEFSVLCMKDALNRDKELQSTRAAIQWCSANAKVVL